MSQINPQRALLVPLMDQFGSPEMAVDGSTTPIVFRYTVPLGFALNLTSLSLALIDSKSLIGEEFGNEDALANGVLFEIFDAADNNPNGSLFANLQRNGDFAAFSTSSAGLGSVGARFEARDITGFDSITIPQLWGVRATVRDDLSELVSFRAILWALLVDSNPTL